MKGKRIRSLLRRIGFTASVVLTAVATNNIYTDHVFDMRWLITAVMAIAASDALRPQISVKELAERVQHHLTESGKRRAAPKGRRTPRRRASRRRAARWQWRAVIVCICAALLLANIVHDWRSDYRRLSNQPGAVMTTACPDTSPVVQIDTVKQTISDSDIRNYSILGTFINDTAHPVTIQAVGFYAGTADPSFLPLYVDSHFKPLGVGDAEAEPATDHHIPTLVPAYGKLRFHSTWSVHKDRIPANLSPENVTATVDFPDNLTAGPVVTRHWDWHGSACIEW